MPLNFIKSQKGIDQLRHNGYLYTRDREANEKIYWKCVEFNKFKCKGRIHTTKEEVIKVIGEHNHEKRIAAIEAKKIMNDVKDMASTRTDSPQQILGNISATLSMSVAAQLPDVSLIKRTIRRKRQKVNNAPANPRSLEELIIPDAFKKTKKNENFLFYDSGSDEQRIILFATQKSISMLISSPHWYADGTFKTSPNLFAQIYTIHGIQNFNVMPAVYALLPNKNEETYIRMLNALKANAPTLSPSSVMTDFETGAQNAFREVFPTVEIRGCFFHFSQALYRRIQANRALKEMYEDSEITENALHIRQLAALAFVPKDDVSSSFSMLMDTDFYRANEEVLLPLLDYFEGTWIGRSIGQSNIRRRARFPIELWNCYSWTLDGLPRTNNAVEGWHRSFHSLISSEHPTVWKCIDGFKNDYALNELKLEQLIAGSQTPSKKAYKDCASRILSIVQQYGERNIIDYLRGIAHNLSLQV